MNAVTTTPPTLEVLTSEEYQELQADQLEKEFNQEQQAEKSGNLITVFVNSYEKYKTTMPLDEWLVAEFKHYPEVWKDEADITNTAKEVIDTVTRNNEAKVSLYEHIEQGKSQASWVAGRIEQGAKAAGVVNVGEYAGQIDAAIEQANADMEHATFKQSSFTADDVLKERFEEGFAVKGSLNLDGFLAEQHHVDTFNLEAAAQGSSFRAKALVPDGTAYGKNSMDIGIYDADGKLVRRYQAKYGQDAKATQGLWDNGDYRGQQKLVPSDQVQDIEGATDRIEHGGVQSKPLSKGEAKALQEKAQLHEESKKYQWNDVSRGEIAKAIGKQALIGAGMVAGFHGARIVGRRIWNKILGKENQSTSADLREFFDSSVKSAANTGVQVAVSGAMVVSARNGWLGAVLKGTAAKHIAAIAYIGMENAKILYKLARGELTSIEAVDAMGKMTTSMAISIASAAQGLALGASFGAVLGPVGAFAGGLVGGIVGGIAGSKIGEYIYQGGKIIVKSAVSAVRSTASAIYSGVKSIVSACNPLKWFS